MAQVILFELIHSCIHEKQRRIIFWNDTTSRNNSVIFGSEILQELTTQFFCGVNGRNLHRGATFKNLSTQPPTRTEKHSIFENSQETYMGRKLNGKDTLITPNWFIMVGKLQKSNVSCAISWILLRRRLLEKRIIFERNDYHRNPGID